MFVCVRVCVQAAAEAAGQEQPASPPGEPEEEAPPAAELPVMDKDNNDDPDPAKPEPVVLEGTLVRSLIWGESVHNCFVLIFFVFFLFMLQQGSPRRPCPTPYTLNPAP